MPESGPHASDAASALILLFQLPIFCYIGMFGSKKIVWKALKIIVSAAALDAYQIFSKFHAVIGPLMIQSH